MYRLTACPCRQSVFFAKDEYHARAANRLAACAPTMARAASP